MLSSAVTAPTPLNSARPRPTSPRSTSSSATPSAELPLSPQVTGRVWKFGDHVCGDDGIIEFAAVRDGFGKPFDLDALRAMCFRKLRPEFPEQVQAGDIVVGGTNFAHHNHVEVSVAIKASGISVVLVESCESGFMRRALSQGLAVATVPGITKVVNDHDIISYDLATGCLTLSSGQQLQSRPFSPQMLSIWQAGGLVNALVHQHTATV